MNKRHIGTVGEGLAKEFLQSLGLSMLDHNVYSSYGEIDIIAMDPADRTVIAVEVKFWSYPVEALEYMITPKKQARMVFTLESYLATHAIPYSYLRYDILHIDRESHQITHIPDAFDSSSLGRVVSRRGDCS